MTAYELRQDIEKVGKVEACRKLDARINSEETANAFLFEYVMRLLLRAEIESQAGNLTGCIDLKVGAALVLWGNQLFDPRPSCVAEVWYGIERGPKVLIQGPGSVGKSYSAMAWFLLDYYADPYYTTTKLISTTAGHAKSNTYATLARLHENSICPMPGIVQSDYLGPDPKKRDAGIEIVAIPQGEDNKGALQGFHPKPRPEPHEVFGRVGRVRGFLDECEEVPAGVWTGIDNMLTGISGAARIKVAGAYNPKDISSKTATNAEPIEGWDSFDVETGVRGSNRWLSKEGWHVTRLDGKRFENVAERREIYPGFLTIEGYRNLELKNGGMSPEYFTFARGAYPPNSAVAIIVHSKHIAAQRGEFTFEGSTTPWSSCDIAVDGRDDAVMTRGRVGWAISFRRVKREGDREKVEVVKFKQRRLAVQVDQQISIAKGETKIVGDNIIKFSKAWGVAPEWVCVDRTGNGASVHDYIRAVWDESVQGIDFNEKASEVPILEEDTQTPLELYDGIVTEVWFALSKWLEFGFLAISPNVQSDPLERELRTRRYELGTGKKLRVEKKDDYKLRMGAKSPDRADSLTIGLQGVRQKLGALGSSSSEVQKEKPQSSEQRVTHGVVDKVKWIDGGPLRGL